MKISLLFCFGVLGCGVANATVTPITRSTDSWNEGSTQSWWNSWWGDSTTTRSWWNRWWGEATTTESWNRWDSSEEPTTPAPWQENATRSWWNSWWGEATTESWQDYTTTRSWWNGWWGNSATTESWQDYTTAQSWWNRWWGEATTTESWNWWGSSDEPTTPAPWQEYSTRSWWNSWWGEATTEDPWQNYTTPQYWWNRWNPWREGSTESWQDYTTTRSWWNRWNPWGEATTSESSTPWWWNEESNTSPWWEETTTGYPWEEETTTTWEPWQKPSSPRPWWDHWNPRRDDLRTTRKPWWWEFTKPLSTKDPRWYPWERLTTTIPEWRPARETRNPYEHFQRPWRTERLPPWFQMNTSPPSSSASRDDGIRVDIMLFVAAGGLFLGAVIVAAIVFLVLRKYKGRRPQSADLEGQTNLAFVLPPEMPVAQKLTPVPSAEKQDATQLQTCCVSYDALPQKE